MDCCWPHFAKIQRAYDIKVVLLLVIGVEGASLLTAVYPVSQPVSRRVSGCLPAMRRLSAPPAHTTIFPCPTTLLAPIIREKTSLSFFTFLSSELLPSMNSDWWLQTIWMKTTQQWWFTSMMSTTTPLSLTDPPMRHKSQRRMTEICPKECSRLLLHKSGVSLEAFSEVLSTIFLSLFLSLTDFLLFTFCLHF